MKALFVLLVLSGQVLPVRSTHSVAFELGEEVHLANAVGLRGGYAVGCAHTLRGAGGPVTVGGRPTRVLYSGADLVLYYTGMPGGARLAAWRPERGVIVGDGDGLVHRYHDHGTRSLRTRSVVWSAGSYIAEGSVPGMSGSGVYLPSGELVAIVEDTSGFCWNLVHLSGFMEAAGVLDEVTR